MGETTGWRDAVRPYVQPAPLAALFLGISSGFPYAMIGATLTTRLAQDGIDKKSVTAFSLAFLVYNLKFLWAWLVDGVRLPLIGGLGQRVSWLLLAGVLVMAAVVNLALVDPHASLLATAYAAVLVGLAGATFDIVIDAYRIELLSAEQLGVGSGMSQYGWRIGSAGAGALALLLAARSGWSVAYIACAALALPAMLAGLVMGEPERHREPASKPGLANQLRAIWGPLAEFFQRQGAALVLLFILLHKIGDTLANLTLRLLFEDLGFTNDEIATWDVGVGFWAYLIGIFVGGILFARMGLKRSVMVSLILMAVSNLSFAALAGFGNSQAVFVVLKLPQLVQGADGSCILAFIKASITQGEMALGASIGFENFASGIGGVTVVAYFSALCDLRYTAAQYALISAAASVVGRLVTGTSAGALMERFGNVDFYILTTIAALPGIALYWWMLRAGLIDESVGRDDPAT